MAKRTKSLSQHLGGTKGSLLAQQLRAGPLEKTLIVPIEIGKSHHKACVADYFGSILQEPFEFHSSQEGLRLLDKTISKVSTAHHMEQVLVALEATGHYYKQPASCLYKLGYEHLFILNPLSSSQCRKAGLVWSKTDDVDLKAIGQALLSGYGTPYRPEQPLWDDLRELCRYRRFQVGHQTALKNKIHGLLDLLLPGITDLEMFKDLNLWHRASVEFLGTYPQVDRIAGLKPQNVVQFFRRRGRRLSPQAAHQLIRWTEQTFRHSAAVHLLRQEILQGLLDQLKELSQQISQLEVKLVGYLVRIPAVVLLSIDYVGPIGAGELAGEMPSVEDYPHSRTLIKAAGLDPTSYQSSTRASSDHPISKKGSARLRYISTQIGDRLMRHNAYFAHYAHRLIQRGKSPDCACVATATRFLRVAYWMIKDHKPFQPQNGLGISKDPLGKIQAFLRERQASDQAEEYIDLAKKYLAPTQPQEDPM